MSLTKLKEVGTKLRLLIDEHKAEPVNAVIDDWATIVTHFRDLQDSYRNVKGTLQNCEQRANNLDVDLGNMRKLYDELREQVADRSTSENDAKVLRIELAALKVDIQGKERMLEEYDQETTNVAALLDELEKQLRSTKKQLDQCNKDKQMIVKIREKPESQEVPSGMIKGGTARDMSVDRRSENSDYSMTSAGPSSSNSAALTVKRGSLQMDLISPTKRFSNTEGEEAKNEEDEDDEEDEEDEEGEEQKLLLKGPSKSKTAKPPKKKFDDMTRVELMNELNNKKKGAQDRLDKWTAKHGFTNQKGAGAVKRREANLEAMLLKLGK